MSHTLALGRRYPLVWYVLPVLSVMLADTVAVNLGQVMVR